MQGNLPVQFFGEGVAVTPPPYPTALDHFPAPPRLRRSSGAAPTPRRAFSAGAATTRQPAAAPGAADSTPGAPTSRVGEDSTHPAPLAQGPVDPSVDHPE